MWMQRVHELWTCAYDSLELVNTDGDQLINRKQLGKYPFIIFVQYWDYDCIYSFILITVMFYNAWIYIM